jgi:hypothetical protein
MSTATAILQSTAPENDAAMPVGATVILRLLFFYVLWFCNLLNQKMVMAHRRRCELIFSARRYSAQF